MDTSTINIRQTIITTSLQTAGIAATLKLAPKGKRWPWITAILVTGEIASFFMTRHNLGKNAKKYGGKLVKYSVIDHVKFLTCDELPEECIEFDS